MFIYNDYYFMFRINFIIYAFKKSGYHPTVIKTLTDFSKNTN